MNFKEINSTIEVINSYLELVKSNIEVISLKTEANKSESEVSNIKIEVSKCNSYVDKLIKEVNSFTIELINLKSEVNSSANSVDILDERLWKLLYAEMKKEPGKRFYFKRVPEFLAGIFLLITKRETCGSHDIKTTFKLGHSTYLRYMKHLRKWDWVQYAPDRKREIFVLSEKGKEILQRILSAEK